MNPVTDLEERQAWDQYVAAVIASFDVARPDLAAKRAAEVADALLTERRQRFESRSEGPER